MISPAAELARCLLCGSPGFPGTPCRTCLVPRPPLDVVVEAGHCSRCGLALDPMLVGPGAGTRMLACRSCRWTFLPPRAWALVFSDASVAQEIETRVPVPTIFVEQAMPIMPCPACGKAMDRARFAAASPSVIDVCPSQHGVWVDAGELVRIASYVPSRDGVADSHRDIAHRDRPEIAASILRENKEQLARVAAASSRAPSLVIITITFIIGVVAIAAGLKVIGRDCRNLDQPTEIESP